MNNKYQNGKIYLIYSKKYPIMYYGSTCKTIQERLNKHEDDYKRFLNGKKECITSYNIIELGNYDILLVEEYPCNSKKELEAREAHYIRNNFHLCVNKRIAGRTYKEWYDDNREKMRKYHREDYKDNKEEILTRQKEKVSCPL